jgi:hypothetical protein
MLAAITSTNDRATAFLLGEYDPMLSNQTFKKAKEFLKTA